MKYLQDKKDKTVNTENQSITYLKDMLYLPLTQQFGINKTIPLYNILSVKCMCQ